jgi:hypothetical protein
MIEIVQEIVKEVRIMGGHERTGADGGRGTKGTFSFDVKITRSMLCA